MELKVNVFSSLKEKIGSSYTFINITEPATVSDLLIALFNKFPQIQPYSGTLLVSLNLEYADRSQLITADDEISIFPPVSGG